MSADSSVITKRFLKACIGWIRYKPLLLYITQRDSYETEIMKIKENLSNIMPKICNYFGTEEFKKVLDELEFYDEHVEEHYKDFENTKLAWEKVMNFLKIN